MSSFGLAGVFSTGKWRVSDEDGTRRGHYIEVPDVAEWLRQIMGLCLMSPREILRSWAFLKVPPPFVHDAALLQQLRRFAHYVESTWIQRPTRRARGQGGPFFPPELWSHWDNAGPRTTNLAEGWHSVLAAAFPNMTRPRLSVVLPWLQTRWADNQVRTRRLLKGHAPKKSKKVYDVLNGWIAEAKASFSAKLVTLDPSSLEYVMAVYVYLRRASKLVGVKKVNEQSSSLFFLFFFSFLTKKNSFPFQCALTSQ
jgi:hypothetical protein